MRRLRFGKKIKRSPLYGFFTSLLLFVIVIVLFSFAISAVGKGTVKRQQEALEHAVMRGITACYADEGRYPESINYLIDNYGLRFNEDRFYVDYRVSGSNVRPEFTIVLQEE